MAKKKECDIDKLVAEFQKREQYIGEHQEEIRRKEMKRLGLDEWLKRVKG